MTDTEQPLTPVEIRDGQENDADKIAEFQMAMALETENKHLDPEIVGRAVRKAIADPAKGFYLVAERQGEVVGSLLITFEWSDWRDSWLWYIQSVYVDRPHRGRGVFKRLYQRVIELAQARGVLFVRLYVETDNKQAQGIYESLGMKRMPYYMYDIRVRE